MIRLAIFGSPVAQSKSPAIHAHFAAQFGLQLDYEKIEATVDTFPDLVREFGCSGGTGCNITVPLKQAAFAVASQVSAAAQQAQAINTLHFRTKDDWFGTNTDGEGLLRDLLRLLPGGLHASRILIVGAGGATAGIIGPLLGARPAGLVVTNRNLQKADKLSETFVPFGPVSACSMDNLHSQSPFDLIINATSMGHQGEAPVLPEKCFKPDSFCYDLNYGIAATAWRQQCKDRFDSRQVSFSDGLGMLVEQAALSFELWTGSRPDTDPVRQMLRQDLPATR